MADFMSQKEIDAMLSEVTADPVPATNTPVVIQGSQLRGRVFKVTPRRFPRIVFPYRSPVIKLRHILSGATLIETIPEYRRRVYGN